MRSALRRIRPVLDDWLSGLHRPVSIQSLAVFRMAFGAIMVWDTWRFFHFDRIDRYYVEPDFFFGYVAFSWAQPLPAPYIQLAWLAVGVFAFLVMTGLFYRVAIVSFTVVFLYFFLLDKTHYLNHFYMVLLFAGLLCLLPANRAYSLDARLGIVRRSEFVPRWSVWALRAQLEIILVYAGLVKITEDWLRLEPLGMWLRDAADRSVFGTLVYQDWVVAVGAYCTIALHVIGAPLLLWRRTRLTVFLIYVGFHLSNSDLFNIGIFPWLTIAATTIFFEPDWPRRLAAWLHGQFQTLPELPVAAPAGPGRASRAGRAIVVVLFVWMVVQLAVPWRNTLYASEVRWSGEGHRFSWRMKMINREGRGGFRIVDAATGREWAVQPEEFLTPRQARKMRVRPDMILQFAHHLEATWQQRGYADVAVHADIEKALNGRAFQRYVRTDVDLTKIEPSLFKPIDWLEPLTTPLLPWRERTDETAAMPEISPR